MADTDARPVVPEWVDDRPVGALGDDARPRETTDEPFERSSEDHLLLALYDHLTERDARERAWQFRRLVAGHLVVGAILLVAVLTGTVQFVALAPFVYGVVVLDALEVGIRRLYLQERLAVVEGRLAEREPLYEWVTRYGSFGDARRIALRGVDLDAAPSLARYGLVLVIYVALVGAGLLTWAPVESGTGPDSAWPLGVTPVVLLAGYAVFSVLVGVVVGVGYLHYERVRRHVAAMDESAREDGTAGEPGVAQTRIAEFEGDGEPGTGEFGGDGESVGGG